MKKTLLFAAVSLVGLASCSRNEVYVPTPEPQAISFDSYVGNAPTKGTENNAASLQTSGFGVNAVHNVSGGNVTTPNFMYNEHVTYTAANAATNPWSYSPIKYWPTTATDVISFYAWAPYGTDSGVTLKGNTAAANTLDFAVKTSTPSSMVDFVAASRIGLNKTNNNKTSVDFNFKHELSRLRFSAVTDAAVVNDASSHVYIRSIKINNVANSQIYKSATYTFSSTDAGVGSWASPVSNDAEMDLSSVMPLAVPTSTISTSTYDKQVVEVTSSDATSPTSLFKATSGSEEYLFLIPVSGGTTADLNTVTFVYDIVTDDDELNGDHYATTTTAVVALPAGILQQGVAYNVCFKIGVDQISIGTVNIEPWGNETGNSSNPVEIK